MATCATQSANGTMTDVEFPVGPIDFSMPIDADTVVAIESWVDAGVAMVTVVFTDGEIESLPMTKAEARAKAEHCFGPDVLTEITENGVSYRWTRLSHSE